MSNQQLAFVYGFEGIDIGVQSLALGFGTLVGSVIIPAFAHKIKHIRAQLIAACVIQTIAFGLLALATPDRLPLALAMEFFGYIPFGWITILSCATVSLHVSHRYLGLAVGLVGLFRNM